MVSNLPKNAGPPPARLAGRKGLVCQGFTDEDAIMKRFILLALSVLALDASDVSGQLIFGCDAGLHGSQVVPPTNSQGGGSFDFTFAACPGCYDCETGALVDSLAMVFYYEGLSGPPTGAALFAGDRGANGPLFLEITNSSFVSGDTMYVQIPPEQCYRFYDSAYVIVTTAAYPDGEIRGQLFCHVDPVLSRSWGALRVAFR
jgi:hypothetical protein